jgi:uncharacterized membrane protein (DUF485 family)
MQTRITILTYDDPSQAEVDQSLLEASGFTVFLTDFVMTQLDIGRAASIQLQVPSDQAAAASAFLRQANPSRFGDAATIQRIEQNIGRSVFRFSVLCSISALVLFFTYVTDGTFGERLIEAIVMSIPVGLLFWLGHGFIIRKRKSANQPPLQTAVSGTPAAGAPVAPPPGAASR